MPPPGEGGRAQRAETKDREQDCGVFINVAIVALLWGRLATAS
jgi:hypothetical protein